MAAARICMQHWSRAYRGILTRSGLRILDLSGYVDDGRQLSSTLRRGMRFRKESNKFEYSKEAEEEDNALNEPSNVRMARVCRDAMNSVSADLQFTTECPEEFPRCRLPTLDFKLWIVNGQLLHNYFENEMRTPFVTMKRTAEDGHPLQ